MDEKTRVMRVFVLFDLPVATELDRKNYRLFRKAIIKMGFIMLQESVYTKLALTAQDAHRIALEVSSLAPPSGVVHIMKVTEKQFVHMINVNNSTSRDHYCMSTDDVIVL